MNLCIDGHDEVCYEGRDCPVCEKLRIISDFEDEVAKLKDQIDELQQEVK